MTDIRKGFAVRIDVHTPTLNNCSPEDIRFSIAAALEESAKPLLQEEVDFTVHVERIYESVANPSPLHEDGCECDVCVNAGFWQDGAAERGEGPR